MKSDKNSILNYGKELSVSIAMDNGINCSLEATIVDGNIRYFVEKEFKRGELTDFPTALEDYVRTCFKSFNNCSTTTAPDDIEENTIEKSEVEILEEKLVKANANIRELIGDTIESLKSDMDNCCPLSECNHNHKTCQECKAAYFEDLENEMLKNCIVE